MAKIYVTPIDWNAPGSYFERKAAFSVMKKFDKWQQDKATASMLDYYEAFDAFLLPRLRTEDGTPVEDVLAQISANEYDRLLRAAGGDSEAVGESSASS